MFPKMIVCLLFCCFAFSETVSLFILKNVELDTSIELFQLDKQHLSALQKNTISSSMYEEFKRNEYPLSENAKVSESFSKYGRVWTIRDTIQNYLLYERNNSIPVMITDSPWWSELSLRVAGVSKNKLKEQARVKVTLWNQKQNIVSYYFLLPKQKENFQENWGPLNEATQVVWNGVYRVTLEIPLEEQTQKFRSEWQDTFGSKLPRTYEKKIEISLPESPKDRKSIQKFYIERIKDLNELFLEVQVSEQKALEIQRGAEEKNQFVENGRFSGHKWRSWLFIYSEKLRKQKDMIENYSHKFFPQQYPHTHQVLLSHCNILFRLSRSVTIQLYRVYNVIQKAPDVERISMQQTIQYLRVLHDKYQDELQLNLQKELGYIPPLRLNK